MGWFSPIKGHYPSLGQIDMSLPVDSTSATSITRGTIIEMTNTGTFKVATTATNAGLLYISLQDYTDAQAGMAGTTAFDGNVQAISEGIIDIPGVTAGVPKITGLSLGMDGEYETDQFDKATASYKITETTPVGTALTVKNGLLAVAQSNENVVGYLTATVSTRWVNDAAAKSQAGKVVRQGANANVIRFRTK